MYNEINPTKVCTKCKVEGPISTFNFTQESKVSDDCKACRTEKNKLHRERRAGEEEMISR